jgi:hypothetical protein
VGCCSLHCHREKLEDAAPIDGPGKELALNCGGISRLPCHVRGVFRNRNTMAAASEVLFRIRP